MKFRMQKYPLTLLFMAMSLTLNVYAKNALTLSQLSQTKSNYIPGEVLVKFKPKLVLSNQTQVITEVGAKKNCRHQ